MEYGTLATLEELILSHGVAPTAMGRPMGDAQEGPWSWKPVQFYKAFSHVSRRVADRPLSLSAEQTAAMTAIYPGFDARYWDLHILVRVWLMNTIPVDDNEGLLTRLFEHAEVKELIALYRGLYTLRNRERFGAQVAEGVRTNMRSVFDAIALRNPITPEVLDEVGWAQVVLKAIFMDRPLYQILRLDERRTLALALTASDYVHERWAAGRAVCPELWRLMVGLPNERIYADLMKAAQLPDELTKQAAHLALRQSAETDPKAAEFHGDLPPFTPLYDTWEALGVAYDRTKSSNDALHVLYPAPKRHHATPDERLQDL